MFRIIGRRIDQNWIQWSVAAAAFRSNGRIGHRDFSQVISAGISVLTSSKMYNSEKWEIQPDIISTMKHRRTFSKFVSRISDYLLTLLQSGWPKRDEDDGDLLRLSSEKSNWRPKLKKETQWRHALLEREASGAHAPSSLLKWHLNKTSQANKDLHFTGPTKKGRVKIRIMGRILDVQWINL